MPEPSRPRHARLYGLLVVAGLGVLAVGTLPGRFTGTETPTPAPTGTASPCSTQAGTVNDCRFAKTTDSLQAYWKSYLGRRDTPFRPARVVLFSERVRTPCRTVTPKVGPFYCPNNHTIYLYQPFFDTLQRDYADKGGQLAQGYVVAHEYGHHVQALLGIMRPGRSSSLRTELQADCYAGVWVKEAVRTGFYPRPFSHADIHQTFDIAQRIGVENFGGREPHPDQTARGGFDQREKWFTTGYDTGDPARCDTFSGGI